MRSRRWCQVQWGTVTDVSIGTGTRMTEIRRQALADYPDVFTVVAIDALGALSAFERDRRELMAKRLARRSDRANNRRRIEFLDPGAHIARTTLTVKAVCSGASFLACTRTSVNVMVVPVAVTVPVAPPSNSNGTSTPCVFRPSLRVNTIR